LFLSISQAILSASLIKSILSLTNINPLVKISGPAKTSFVSLSKVAVIITIPLLLLTNGISTFQTDEFYNTESYNLSMPLSRKQIVLSKFIYTLIMLVISFIVGVILYGFVYIVFNPSNRGLNADMLKYLAMLEVTGLIFDSLLYPAIYKFGCEKSRLVLMGSIMLILGFVLLLNTYLSVLDIGTFDIEGVIDNIKKYAPYVLVVSSIILMIGSYFLSVFVYKKRDY